MAVRANRENQFKLMYDSIRGKAELIKEQAESMQTDMT
jgi:hypothetical protein